MENGIDLHFFYKKTLEEKYLKNWKEVQPKTAELMTYFSENVGQYPYKQYSVVQGGDGGMEYAMSTLVTGQRSFGSLFVSSVYVCFPPICTREGGVSMDRIYDLVRLLDVDV